SLEYIVDQGEGGPGPGGAAAAADDVEDKPLLQEMLESGGSESVDAMPLLTRLLLAEHFGRRSGRGGIEDSATWFVYCNQCNIVIRTFRYYCTGCERPSDGYDYESYDLCLMCFSKQFPPEHPHPRAMFARAAVSDAGSIVQFTTSVLDQCRGQERPTAAAAAVAHMADLFSGLQVPYELDVLDTAYNPDTADSSSSLWNKLAVGLHGTTTSANPLGRSAVLGRILGGPRRQQQQQTGDDGGDVGSEELVRRCAFCGEDGSSQPDVLGGFAGDRPFILTTAAADGAVRRRQRFWAHDACARYSPEVLATDDGRWYNVAAALRRTRAMKCAVCRRRGATIGCFHDRCQKSYHVACTRRPRDFFASGRIFWCPKHAAAAAAAAAANGEDDSDAAPAAPEPPSECASCARRLAGDLMWMVCLECPSEPALRFNICLACYESKDTLADHPHKRRCFREHLAHAAGVSSTGQYLDELAGAAAGRRKRQRPVTCCHYCRSRQSRRWRKGYGGVVMCERCFGVANGHH
ncbi:hypothetical protein IWQ56_005631, partial [Coemansia nantahalensis]